MTHKYLETNEWKIIERNWKTENQIKSESIFSIGNGRMGQRANNEEKFSGKSLQGTYIAGVYYPDKTKVGWWKNGYPEYFAKVLNAVNWIGLNVVVEGEELDLHTAEVSDFYRELDMQHGLLRRSFTATLSNGKSIRVEASRLMSIVRDEVATLTYSITPLNFNGTIQLTPYLDFDVSNSDANWEEKFWAEVDTHVSDYAGRVTAKTKKLDFHVCAAMQWTIDGGEAQNLKTSTSLNYIESKFDVAVSEGKTITFNKYVGITSSFNYPVEELTGRSEKLASEAQSAGYSALEKEHAHAWLAKWDTSDIVISGDADAQQAIRFNIFHMNQTFTGVDERLNIGPKGFTGEKYGGSTYWDTEAYCLPFYLATADQSVARNLLIYRYKQLDKAIENAAKLGFKDGAALYPMVTMNGEECHNEWEITFEEIHRNGAIAYAIFNYIRHTQDRAYLAEYGFEVLLGIARFWAQRVNWSESRQKYVMLGVTGPNEYENNVNNNFYTNKIASWCLQYAIETVDYLKSEHADRYQELCGKTNFHDKSEIKHWRDVIANMYYPFDEQRHIFLQQDGFLDKELRPAHSLDSSDRPINQNWSWDRILRSCFIKQADVLQGLYFFEHQYDRATIRRNFDFYEPMTVHESSLSPCVHVILASRIGYREKAYELYLRTARLDLDDYNREVYQGLHITSMAGTWMSVVQGFGGMHITKEQLNFEPLLPQQWSELKFRILWRGSVLNIEIKHGTFSIENTADTASKFHLKGIPYTVEAGQNLEIKY